jgi:ubiquinone/menaquinone biosynthesis C-methylase UbiE
MKLYDRLAEVYDSGGWDEYSRRLLPYLHEVLRRFRFRQKSVLDLACGTGTLAIALAQEGYRVVGVDRSAAMLQQARDKSRQAKVQVTFLRQDMRKLSLKEGVDLATCFFDSINYLLSYQDLVSTFARVAWALNPGGLFVFDINTPSGLASHWDHHKGARDLGDVAIIGTNSYDPENKLGTISITVFKKRAYSTSEVKNALREGGLKLLAHYDCMTFRRPGKKTGRILCVAKRP